MAASDHLNGHQFRLHHDPPLVTGHYEDDPEGEYPGKQRWVDEDPATGHHILSASTGNNKPLGLMTWNKGVVGNVEVFDPDKWGRRGMATQMWQKANEITPGLRHSNNRSDMGDAWVKKVGGQAPERMQDHPEWFTSE